MTEPTDATGSGRTRRGGRSTATLSAVVGVLIGVAAAVAHALTDSVSAAAGALVAAAATVGSLAIIVGSRRARGADGISIHRERLFWPFVISAGALVAAAAGAATFGVIRVREPVEPTDPVVAIAVLVAAIVLQGLVVRFAAVRVNDARGELRVGPFLRRADRPDLPVAFLGAVGVLVALVVAAAGIGASTALDEPSWDGVGAIAAAAVAAITAFVLIVEVRSLLVSGAASTRDQEAIRAALEVEPVVIELAEVHVVRVGPEALLVAARIGFLDELDVGEVAAALDRVGRNVRGAVPAVEALFVEPAVDPARRRDEPFVADLVGHIDPDDPSYASITGRHLAVDDDDIWS